MLKKAEEEGKIKKNNTMIIEPTSGNTGIALAAIAKLMGYKSEMVVPNAATAETKQTLREVLHSINVTVLLISTCILLIVLL
jgi:cysteine synthase B